MLQTFKILSGMACTSARHHHVDWSKIVFFWQEPAAAQGESQRQDNTLSPVYNLAGNASVEVFYKQFLMKIRYVPDFC
jgi:hypothetical protein